MVLRAQPACAVCGAPATDVDHVVPRRLGGRDALDNLQPLCHACHSRKTNRERAGS
jgi:5-methylcytosine-specific restriction protein A